MLTFEQFARFLKWERIGDVKAGAFHISKNILQSFVLLYQLQGCNSTNTCNDNLNWHVLHPPGTRPGYGVLKDAHP
jgi:hypothetical protein